MLFLAAVSSVLPNSPGGTQKQLPVKIISFLDNGENSDSDEYSFNSDDSNDRRRVMEQHALRIYVRVHRFEWCNARNLKLFPTDE